MTGDGGTSAVDTSIGPSATVVVVDGGAAVVLTIVVATVVSAAVDGVVVSAAPPPSSPPHTLSAMSAQMLSDRAARLGTAQLFCRVNEPWMFTLYSSALVIETPDTPSHWKSPAAAVSSFVDIETLHSLPMTPPAVTSSAVTNTADSCAGSLLNAICDAFDPIGVVGERHDRDVSLRERPTGDVR